MYHEDLLDIKINDELTIGEYFIKLLTTLWVEGESFSGKRPFGDSGWQHEIYIALANADIIENEKDEDGEVIDYDTVEADQLCINIIRLLYKPKE